MKKERSSDQTGKQALLNKLVVHNECDSSFVIKYALSCSVPSELKRVVPHCNTTVDFTSHGMPVAVAVGNLWFVWAIDCNVNVANRTNHKFPAAMATVFHVK